ncbi:hypothetical protein LTR81_022043 [Elasticomyces elasticus]
MSGSNVGVWTNMVAVDPRTLKRSYSATAYYLRHANRKNLVVITSALAHEVTLEQDHKNWVAKGIRYEHEGDEYHAKASEEVIISAGSVASPQLLEVSGIGNPAVLEAAKISVRVANINVGEHVQDHMMTATIFEVDPSTPTQDDLRTDPNLAAAADGQYSASQSGPRTVLPGSFCYLPLSQFIPADKLSALAERARNYLPSTPTNVLRSSRLFGTQGLGSIEYIFDLGNWSPFHMAEPGK